MWKAREAGTEFPSDDFPIENMRSRSLLTSLQVIERWFEMTRDERNERTVITVSDLVFIKSGNDMLLVRRDVADTLAEAHDVLSKVVVCGVCGRRFPSVRSRWYEIQHTHASIVGVVIRHCPSCSKALLAGTAGGKR